MIDMPRVRMLRRQVEALTAFRDAMSSAMGSDEYDDLAKLMAPMTDRVLHELARAEQGPAYAPYPHPMANEWWAGFALAAAGTPDEGGTDG